MKALQYRKSIPRYALLKLLGPRFRRLYTSGASPLALREIAEPKLPTQQWVRITPRLSGICGSDLATICARGSPYLAPVTSMPFVMGHEVVGTVVEVGREIVESAVRTGLNIGDRVVLRPTLGCQARGIIPPCDACRQGHDALCRNVTRGDVSPGIQTGFCRDTGGAFGENLVAHQSQVYPVPDELDDRAAVLIEPFACALHGALRVAPIFNQLTDEKGTILVIGCGAIGLLTIAALRALRCRARIVAVAKYDHQREHAFELGADELPDTRGSIKERYAAWAKALNADVLEPPIGKPTVIGGADVTFDCVASSQSIDDGLRFTQSGGTFVLVGMPSVSVGPVFNRSSIDWTPLWFKELTIHAAYAYGPERAVGFSLRGSARVKTRGSPGNRDTFAIAIDLMRSWGSKLARLVGPPFCLADYRAALASAINTGQSRVVKTVFAIDNR